jgi:hypothetical protein
MIMTLYNKTKQLIQLIKEKKPEIEIATDKAINEYGMIVDRQYSSVYLDHPEIHVPLPTAQSLLTLIPQLFGDTMNPVWQKENDKWPNGSFHDEAYEKAEKAGNDALKRDLILSSYYKTEWLPKTISELLLTHYFVDGLWLHSEEETIQDIIDNINTYL